MANFDKAVTQVWRKNIDSLERLINEDSSILEMKNKYGRTLLHFAVNENAIDIVKMLINYGADLNVKNILDWTPLHRSIEKRNPDIAKYLIMSGADISLKDADGYTAIDLIQDEEIKEQLLSLYQDKKNDK